MAKKGVTYVNHTFTSHLALSASLQPYVGLKEDIICEYPVEPKQLALDITTGHIALNKSGEVAVPEKPGLGVDINVKALQPYLVETDIFIKGKRVYSTPDL